MALRRGAVVDLGLLAVGSRLNIRFTRMLSTTLENEATSAFDRVAPDSITLSPTSSPEPRPSTPTTSPRRVISPLAKR